MGLKNKALVGMMALCLVGGVSSAFALTGKAATATGTASLDKAIYLYWDTNSESKTIPACNELTTNVPVYRYLAVTSKSSKSVGGVVTLSFEMAVTSGDYHLNGVTISVYQTESLATDQTVDDLIDNVVAAPVLDSAHLTGSTTFNVTATGNATNTTQAFYAIEVVYDGTFVQNKTLGGSLTVTQSFAPAQA